jgi:hypothetical protein
MRRVDLFRKLDKNGFVVAVMHLAAIIFLLVVLIISAVLTYGCEGVLGSNDADGDGKGQLVLGFAREFGAAVGQSGVADVCGSPDVNGELDYTAAAAGVPDTNAFVLSISSSSGEVVYKGRYDGRPDEIMLDQGSYDVKVASREFDAPQFDAPCYSDSATVMIETGKIARLSFLCTMSNGAVRLGFSGDFKERFRDYVAVLEGSGGSVEYPYTESRFLYMIPGDIFVKMKSTESSDLFLVTRKVLSQREMVTVNLHSSVTSDPPPGGDVPGSSNLLTGIQVDTASVWLSEELVVGERRDGSSRELALTADEIAVFEGAKDVWVSGYVAGYLTTASLVCEPPFNIATNIAISSITGEKRRDACAGVSLPSGEIRDALNLKENPQMLGCRIWVKGDITGSYYGLPGVNGVTEYVVD